MFGKLSFAAALATAAFAIELDLDAVSDIECDIGCGADLQVQDCNTSCDLCDCVVAKLYDAITPVQQQLNALEEVFEDVLEALITQYPELNDSGTETADTLLDYLKTNRQVEADADYVTLIYPGEEVIIPTICETNAYIQSVATVQEDADALSRLFNLVVTNDDYTNTCDTVQGLFGKDAVFSGCP